MTVFGLVGSPATIIKACSLLFTDKVIYTYNDLRVFWNICKRISTVDYVIVYPSSSASHSQSVVIDRVE